jgi:hypothetical protein
MGAASSTPTASSWPKRRAQPGRRRQPAAEAGNSAQANDRPCRVNGGSAVGCALSIKTYDHLPVVRGFPW